MFIEQQISIISEGSCDTEDWSNYAENSAFLITGINYILQDLALARQDNPQKMLDLNDESTFICSLFFSVLFE